MPDRRIWGAVWCVRDGGRGGEGTFATGTRPCGVCVGPPPLWTRRTRMAAGPDDADDATVMAAGDQTRWALGCLSGRGSATLPLRLVVRDGMRWPPPPRSQRDATSACSIAGERGGLHLLTRDGTRVSMCASAAGRGNLRLHERGRALRLHNRGVSSAVGRWPPPPSSAAGRGVYAVSSAARRPLSSSPMMGCGLHAFFLRGGTAAFASLVPSSLLAPRPARPPPQTPWSPPIVAT